MILRSRIVHPVSSPPIEDGCLQIENGRITRIGRWQEFKSTAANVTDLGESILLPGLINAHCHLDYTRMAGLIPPTKSFTDWVKSITTLKAGWSYTDFAESWTAGARMLLERGTTTVADIEAVPELLPEVWQATPLRVHSFFEMTGVKSRRLPKVILEEALGHANRLQSSRCRVGLSPHAPYSTVAELLRLSGVTARERQWRVMTHVAESVEEFEMFMHGRGSLHQWLARNERDMTDCGLGSPVRHLERCGLLAENLLVVHANYLDKGDAELLAKHSASVVHCPQSHQYFQHGDFAYEALTQAGVNICLGTDSLATTLHKRGSSVALDMFAEMRTFLAKHNDVSPETVVRMCTIHGAKALGMPGEIGELTTGALADVVAIPYAGAVADVTDAIVNNQSPVLASVIDGAWAIRP